MKKLIFVLSIMFQFSANSVEFKAEQLSMTDQTEYIPYPVASDSNSVVARSGPFGVGWALSTIMTSDAKYVLFYSSDEDLITPGAQTEWLIKNTETRELKPLGKPPLINPAASISSAKISPTGRHIGFKYRGRVFVWDRLKNSSIPASYGSDHSPLDSYNMWSAVYPINEKIAFLTGFRQFSITDLEEKTTKKINTDIYNNDAVMIVSSIRPYSNDGRYIVYSTLRSQMDRNNVDNSPEQGHILYLYDRIEDNHTRIAGSSDENYALITNNPKWFSISADGKYIIYVARRPSNPEYSHYGKNSYLVMYNIETKTYEYVKDTSGLLIQGAYTPSVSNAAESISFTTRNSDYLSVEDVWKPQVVYFDRVNQTMIHPSISQRTDGPSRQDSTPIVYSNGKGVLWEGRGSGLIEGEDASEHIYIMSKSEKAEIPEICLPYLE